MTWIKNRFVRALLLLLGGLVACLGLFLSYVAWTGATVGLAGSSRTIVIENIYGEERMQRIEENRAHAIAERKLTREKLVSEDTEEPATLVRLPAPSATDGSESPAEAEQPGLGIYWTEYRGPGRSGIYEEMPISTAWPDSGPPELWRQEIGGGYASMVVANGQVYTIEQRRDREVVAAYGLTDGYQLWEHSWPDRFSEAMGGDGPRATPTWHGGMVYALGGNGHLVCLKEDDGELLWKRNILKDADTSNLPWGMAGSPLVVDDVLVTVPGGRNGRSIIAYDLDTGDIRWSALDDTAAYASPQLATLGGRRQIVVVTGERILGASTEDGSLLWSHPWGTDWGNNCAQPLIVDDNHVYVSSGYGEGAALLRISELDAGFTATEVWSNKNMKNKFNSAVLVDEVIYGLDEGILAAIDVWTGERLWKGGRYRFGQLLYASGHLIVISEEGDLALVEASPKGHNEIVQFEAIPGKTWNVPALAQGRLLVRNQTHMAAYDLRLN